MKFLVTNDDGIDAPGIAALVEALTPLGTCLVLAPTEHLSGCSHQVTTHRPLHLQPVAEGRFKLDGTPVDCVRVAMAHLRHEFDWVISGINLGGNLGADVYHSGTVAAVREGALLGKPGIAVSRYVRRLPVDWEAASKLATRAVRELLERPLVQGTFYNVNLPDLPSDSGAPRLVDCPLDYGPLPVDYLETEGRLHYRGRYQDRQRTPGSDVDECFGGAISVTRLSIGP